MGESVANGFADFNARCGTTCYNPDLPSNQWDKNVVVPGINTMSPPATVACAIGPNSPPPSGAAAADVTTAGLNVCQLNSDFSTPSFANINSWMGGQGGCGTGTVWLNEPSNTSAAPCSDYNIVTDGANGTVLDITYTNADFAAGRGGAQLISGFFGGPGFTFPNGFYIEARLRWSSTGLHACDGATNVSGCDLQGMFVFPPAGENNPFFEWDVTELFVFATSAGGGQDYRGAQGSTGSGVNFPPVNSGAQWWCTRPGDPPGGVACGSGFDISQMHTYGYLVTTDGVDKMSVCYYSDRTLGVVTKIGCYNYTGITPSPAIFQSLYSIINFTGPGAPGSFPNSFNGPVDQYQQYIRVFSCQAPTFNSPTTTTNICNHALITQ